MIKSGSISELSNIKTIKSATDKSHHLQTLNKSFADFFVSISVDEDHELICLNPYSLLSFLEKAYFINMSLVRDMERSLFSGGTVTIDVGLPIPWILESQKKHEEVLVVFSLSEDLQKIVFTTSNNNRNVLVCDFSLTDFMQKLEMECAKSASKTGLLSETPVFNNDDVKIILH